MCLLRLPLLTLLLLAALGLASCGGDSEETQVFEEEGFPFTFEYPGNLEVSDDVSFDSELGAAPDQTVAVGLDDDNGIVLQRFTLNIEIDANALDQAKAEFDNLIGEVDPSASAETGETAGYPSLSYEAIAVPQPEDGESRLTVLFDGDQEYLVNCQSTPDERETIDAACDQALSTLAAA